MNLLTLVNGIRTFVRNVDFIDFANNAFRIRLTGISTTDRTITLPDDSGTVLLDDRPIGILNAGVALRGWEPILSISTNKTLALSDSGTIQSCVSNQGITVPNNSTVPFPIGTRMEIQRTSGSIPSCVPASGVTLISELGSSPPTFNIFNKITIRKIAINTWLVQNPIGNNIFLPGEPSTGTQPLGNATPSIATTAFVARRSRPIVIASRTTAFTFTTTYTDLVFNNIIRDNSAAYSSTTGVFTAPYGGMYAFSGHVSNFANVSSFTLVGIGSVTNTESLRLGLIAGTGFQVVSSRQMVFLNAGETRRFGVQVGTTNASGTPESTLTSQTTCYMSIEYLGIDT